jgi:uncharacterized protein
MDKDIAISKLRRAEAELRSAGVMRLSLFGSAARGEQQDHSDIDIAAEFDHDHKRFNAFDFLRLEQRLREILGTHVDLVGEPARMPRMQASIDRDRINVF